LERELAAPLADLLLCGKGRGRTTLKFTNCTVLRGGNVKLGPEFVLLQRVDRAGSDFLNSVPMNRFEKTRFSSL
jgi:hypothetical protein